MVTTKTQVLIIGGGIIGLSSALYLRQAGHLVTVIDKGDFLDNCSYGNAGYISPSHFVPLAAPGVLSQGIKWMLDSKSPFYIEPRWSRSLLNWALKFRRHATRQHVERSMPPMRDILLLSKAEYEHWAHDLQLDFAYQPCGMLELYQSPKIAAHADHVVHQAQALGLRARKLNTDQAQALLPSLRLKASGALLFEDDAQIYPQKLMASLLHWMHTHGVELLPYTPALHIHTQAGKATGVHTPHGTIQADHVVLAAGALSHTLAKSIRLNLPLVAGRGYSITLNPTPWYFPMSVILEDAHVAISPMDVNKLRLGGTMEITNPGRKPRLKRIQGILDGVHRFFPDIHIPLPPPDQLWHGYRPLSIDGLPYIGKAPHISNLTIATGHAMLGISMGPATGKLVSQIVSNTPTSIDTTPFSPSRI